MIVVFYITGYYINKKKTHIHPYICSTNFLIVNMFYEKFTFQNMSPTIDNLNCFNILFIL